MLSRAGCNGPFQSVPVIPALGRLKQDLEFEVSVGYAERPHLKMGSGLGTRRGIVPPVLNSLRLRRTGQSPGIQD